MDDPLKGSPSSSRVRGTAIAHGVVIKGVEQSHKYPSKAWSYLKSRMVAFFHFEYTIK